MISIKSKIVAIYFGRLVNNQNESQIDVLIKCLEFLTAVIKPFEMQHNLDEMKLRSTNRSLAINRSPAAEPK